MSSPLLSSPLLSRSSTRGLRRRVARRPQRVLNTAAHFTACKAIISIPLPPLSPRSPHLPLSHHPSGCWYCWVSLPSYGEWLPQPRRYWFAPVCTGEMFPNLSGQFCSAAHPGNTAGRWAPESMENNVNISSITRMLGVWCFGGGGGYKKRAATIHRLVLHY